MASNPTAALPSKTAQTTFVTRTSMLPAAPASSLSPHSHHANLPVTHESKFAQSVYNTPSPSPSILSTCVRHSSYPRPSPPGFLYPHPIVPRAVQNQLQHAPARTEMASSSAIWTLPCGLEVLFFASVVIGLVWVFLRTYPGRVERRPVDKASKYAPVAPRGRGYASARGVLGAEEGEVRQRRQAEHQRSKSSPVTAIRFDIPAPVDSPPNPFLQPPSPTRYLSPARALRTRTSSEWLRQHAAFFSATSSSSSHAEYDQEYDIEALEAGTTPRSPGLKAHRKSLSWADLDLGLDRMEGKVSGWVGKVARWTDDDGGEGVLLPVVNGRQGIKVE